MICYENVFDDCVDCKCFINKKKENNNLIVIELTKVVVAEPIDANETCSICLQEIVNGEKLGSLSCGHKHFHKKCIDEWMQVSGNKSCPLCRKPVFNKIKLFEFKFFYSHSVCKFLSHFFTNLVIKSGSYRSLIISSILHCQNKAPSICMGENPTTAFFSEEFSKYISTSYTQVSELFTT